MKTIKEILVKYGVLILFTVTVVGIILYCVNSYYNRLKQDLSNEVQQFTDGVNQFIDDTQNTIQSGIAGASTVPQLWWLNWFL